MEKKTLIVVGIILIALAGYGVWALTLREPTAQPAPSQQTENKTISQDDASDRQLEALVIRYTDDGFESENYTAKSGQPILVVNESSRTLEFSSDSHPTHRINTELNLAPLQSGEETKFTPEKSGTWGIHDHLKPSAVTKLVVEE